MISNNTSLVEGETALLACVGYSVSGVDISWSFNGQTVQNNSLVTIFEEEVQRGSKIFKKSFLQLCGVVLSDAGGYTCVVSNIFGEIMATNFTVQLMVVMAEGKGFMPLIFFLLMLFFVSS